MWENDNFDENLLSASFATDSEGIEKLLENLAKVYREVLEEIAKKPKEERLVELSRAKIKIEDTVVRLVGLFSKKYWKTHQTKKNAVFILFYFYDWGMGNICNMIKKDAGLGVISKGTGYKYEERGKNDYREHLKTLREIVPEDFHFMMNFSA